MLILPSFSLGVSELEESAVSKETSLFATNQGIGQSSFFATTSATTQTSNYQYNLGDSRIFGDFLFAKMNQGGNSPSFNGNTVCSHTSNIRDSGETYGGNSFDLCRYTLMIINYSSQSLEGIIYSYRDFRFDTSEQAIHIVSRDAPFGPHNATLLVEWPMGSSVRSYLAGNSLIFDKNGTLTSKVQFINAFDSWPGYSTGSGTTDSEAYCGPESILGVSSTTTIVSHSCRFSINGGSNNAELSILI